MPGLTCGVNFPPSATTSLVAVCAPPKTAEAAALSMALSSMMPLVDSFLFRTTGERTVGLILALPLAIVSLNLLFDPYV